MSTLPRTRLVLIVAIGLLATTSLAWADDAAPEEEPPAGDTRISFGYDAENHALVVHTATADETDYDCTLPAGGLTVGYGDDGDKSIDFTADEGAEAVEGECELRGAVVGGPNGQINHGQFMKLFHQIAGKKGNGCLNRIIAQSDLGKGDQQLRTSDVDEEFTPGDALNIEFETFAAVCEPGKKDKGEDHPGNQGKADRPRGKSADAPGRSK